MNAPLVTASTMPEAPSLEAVPTLWVQLTLQATLQAHGERPGHLAWQIRDLIESAVGWGLLTGSTPVECDAWGVTADVTNPNPELPEVRVVLDATLTLNGELADGHVEMIRAALEEHIGRRGLVGATAAECDTWEMRVERLSAPAADAEPQEEGVVPRPTA